MHAALVDMVRVLLVGRNPDRPHDLAVHHLAKTDDRIEWGAQFVAHIGEKHRLGPVGVRQLDRPLLDPAFQCRVQLAKFLFQALLSGVTRAEGVGHRVECRPQMADFRIGVPHLNSFFVVPVAPLGGEVKQTADRLLQKPAAADDRSDGRSKKAETDQPDAAAGRAVDRRDRFRLRLAGAQEQVKWRQCAGT